MSAPLTVLWRGPLESCNYSCPYCPFGKARLSERELAADRAALARFVTWAEGRSGELSVFFTPWGEGLIHRHYQEAIARLSCLPHVRRVAIQTNLSARLDFLSGCAAGKVGLWSTYHPGEVGLERFVAQVGAASAAGARVSAGAVGLPEHIERIEALRSALPASIYVWVNAVTGVAYSRAQAARLAAVDPLFQVSLGRPYPSLGRLCRAGESVVAVDGDGTARRCHFLPEPIGSIYAPDFEAALRPRSCTRAECRCHIGYVHMPSLGLYEVFGEGVLERIPRAAGSSEAAVITSSAAAAARSPGPST